MTSKPGGPFNGHERLKSPARRRNRPALCREITSMRAFLSSFVAYMILEEWDAENLKAKNCPEADQYIQKKYRDGWVLNG